MPYNNVSAAALSEVKGGLVRIAIAYTTNDEEILEMNGKKIKITETDLEEMVRNHPEQRVQDGVRIDYSHLSVMDAVPPGWDRAAGWLREMDGIEPFTEGRKILWGLAEFTPACLAFIRQKEYRYFSPSFKQPPPGGGGTRLIAGAMTNGPALKDLPPIEISAADYPKLLESVSLSECNRILALDPGQVHVPGIVNDPERRNEPQSSRGASSALPKEKNSVKNFKLKKLTDGDDKGKMGVFEGEEMTGLVDGDMKDKCPMCGADMADRKEPDADDVKARELIAADTAFLAEAAKKPSGEIIVLAERASSAGRLSMAGFLRAQKIAQLVDGAIAKGKILPKQRPAMFALATANYDQAAALLSEARPMVDLKSHGIEGDGKIMSAAEDLETAVTAYMCERKVDRAVALTDVTRNDPQLWRRYKSELETMEVAEP